MPFEHGLSNNQQLIFDLFYCYTPSSTITMLRGKFFYTLNGAEGWSRFQKTTIDVFKVQEMEIRQRSFMIFQRDHPYTLRITYDESTVEPTITLRGQNETQVGQIMTKRYKSKADARRDFEEIAFTRQQIKLHLYDQNKFEKF